MGDADARCHRDFQRALLQRLANGQGTAGNVCAVLRSRNGEREREFPRAAGQVFGLSGCRPAAPHQIKSGDRFQRSDQHAAGPALRFGDQIEALVHTVDEVDVGVAGRSENHAGAIGEAARGMRRQIVAAKVGFGLHDDAGSASMYQGFAEKIARDLHGRTLVERAWKDWSPEVRHGYMVAVSCTQTCLMLGNIRLLLLAAVLPAAFAQPSNYSTEGELAPLTVRLPSGVTQSLLFSLNPADLSPESRVTVSVVEGERVLVEKTLHAGDPDLYAIFRAAKRAELKVAVTGAKGRYHLRVQPAAYAAAPGHTWQEAASISLGQVTAASGDEAEYVPLPGSSRKQIAQASAAEQWYRFEFDAAAPKLVFFQVELMDRDDVPVDVSVFRIVDGKPQEFLEGQDPVAQPHEVQALPGNKFAPRVLREKGTYYLRVRANHPEYKLRTRVYDAPPYRNPQDAVRP